MNHHIPLPQQRKNAKYYFGAVSVLSLLWLILFVNSQPEWMQQIKENLQLSPRLEAHENSFYNSRIDPVFEKYCVACHDSNKAKGHLRLDSYRQLTFSGRSEADLTARANNLIVERMSLPATDRLAMPPYGRERHTEQELALIEMWLAKGGSGQLSETDFPNAPAKVKAIKFAEIDWQKIDTLRSPNKTQVEDLQQRFRHRIHYIARTSELLSIDFNKLASNMTDDKLKQLSPVKDLIADLNLSSTHISDRSLELIKSMQALQELRLTDTKISSKTLISLLQLPKLEKVFVDASLVTQSIKAQYADHNIVLYSVQRR